MGCSSAFSCDAGFYSCDCSGPSPAWSADTTAQAQPGTEEGPPWLGWRGCVEGAEKAHWALEEEGGQPWRSGDKLEEERGAKGRRPRQQV